MKDLAELIKKVQEEGNPIEFDEGQPEANIDALEAALVVTLPTSYRDFLSVYGSGGCVGEWISGICKNDPLLPNMGSCYGDTVRCRDKYSIPDDFVVIYTEDDDEILWCLETSKMTSGGECPVVSFDIFGHEPPQKMADSFEDFFVEYLEIRAGL